MTPIERELYAFALWRQRSRLRLALGRLLFRRAFNDVEMP